MSSKIGHPVAPPVRRIAHGGVVDGKRFVVVADISGEMINQHPAYEQVFQPVFVKDGNKLIWKVEKLEGK